MWIIQKNLLNDEAYWRLTIALDNNQIHWKPIDVIPFTDDLDIPFQVSTPVVFYGSTSLQRQVLRNPKLIPGVWAGENFNYEKHISIYGEHMLNHDAEIYPFKDIPEFEDIMFMRPVHDTKAFNGALVDSSEFKEWKSNVLGAHIYMFADTPTLVASPKNIKFEYRLFIVDGKVITSSLYRSNGRLLKRNADANTDSLDKLVKEYAQSQVDVWQPADAFVLDIAVLVDTDSNYHFKIIEINSFNCSGLYQCNEVLIIDAIEKLIHK